VDKFDFNYFSAKSVCVFCFVVIEGNVVQLNE